MAIEEEFSIEIPDKEADAIHSGKVLQRFKSKSSSLTGRSRTSRDLHLRSAGCALRARLVHLVTRRGIKVLPPVHDTSTGVHCMWLDHL